MSQITDTVLFKYNIIETLKKSTKKKKKKTKKKKKNRTKTSNLKKQPKIKACNT